MGLREDKIEALVTELTGHRSIVTLSISLVYLMPERRYIGWEFATADPAVAMLLRDSIRIFGYPAMESLASPEAVAALRERRMTDNQHRAYRLPVAYLLHGRKDLEIRELHHELDSIGERTDMAAVQYRFSPDKLQSRAAKTAVESAE